VRAGAGGPGGAGASGGRGIARRAPVTLLAARGIGRRFSTRVALEPVDVTLTAGEVVALVGPNGAGKSTLLAILAGSLEPSEGTVERAEGVRSGWMPQRPAHYGRLSPRQNLDVFARLEQAGRPRHLLPTLQLPPHA